MNVSKKAALIFFVVICSSCFSKSTDIMDKFEKLNYPSMSKILFSAYEDNDRIRIREILEDKRYCRYKEEILQKAFFWGAEKLEKLSEEKMNYMQKLHVKNAIWRISQDFARESRSTRWLPTVFWTGISTASFLAGGYAQKKYKSWDNFKKWAQSKKAGRRSGRRGRK